MMGQLMEISELRSLVTSYRRGPELVAKYLETHAEFNAESYLSSQYEWIPGHNYMGP